MATEQKYERSPIDVVVSAQRDSYKRGVHDGRIKGDEEGFDRGIQKGIEAIEKLYGEKGSNHEENFG